MKIAEFYPEKQGRPDSKEALDIDARMRIVSPGSSTIGVKPVSLTVGAVSVNYDIENYSVLLVTANSPVEITLPAVETHGGFFYHIKKIDSSGNPVRIKGDAVTETIDGQIYIELDRQYQHVMVVNDASVWYTIGGEYVGLQSAIEEKMDNLISVQQELLLQLKELNLHQTEQDDMDFTQEEFDDAE